MQRRTHFDCSLPNQESPPRVVLAARQNHLNASLRLPSQHDRDSPIPSLPEFLIEPSQASGSDPSADFRLEVPRRRSRGVGVVAHDFGWMEQLGDFPTVNEEW